MNLPMSCTVEWRKLRSAKGVKTSVVVSGALIGRCLWTRKSHQTCSSSFAFSFNTSNTRYNKRIYKSRVEKKLVVEIKCVEKKILRGEKNLAWRKKSAWRKKVRGENECTRNEMLNDHGILLNSRVQSCPGNPCVQSATQLCSCFCGRNYARTALYFSINFFLKIIYETWATCSYNLN